MMDQKMKVVHYLNQFFGQIGGEDKTDTEPLKRDGAVGPGLLFQGIFGQEAEIVGTVICGDNYFNEHPKAPVKLLRTPDRDILKRCDNKKKCEKKKRACEVMSVHLIKPSVV